MVFESFPVLSVVKKTRREIKNIFKFYLNDLYLHFIDSVAFIRFGLWNERKLSFKISSEGLKVERL
jgi:uncharacterized membrane protein YiaA